MKKNQIILIIIGILILIGLVSGFSYQFGQKSVEVKSGAAVPNFLTSKVIQKWNAVASGRIADISGHSLVLNRDDGTLVIPISEEAAIYRSNTEKEGEKPQSLRFEDIKIGDEVNVSVKMSDGNIEGEIVIISVTE